MACNAPVLLSCSSVSLPCYHPENRARSSAQWADLQGPGKVSARAATRVPWWQESRCPCFFLPASVCSWRQAGKLTWWLQGMNLQEMGCSYWLLSVPARRTGCLALAQLKVSKRKSGMGAETGGEGLLSTQKKQVNSTGQSGRGCCSWLLSGDKQQCLARISSCKLSTALKAYYNYKIVSSNY